MQTRRLSSMSSSPRDFSASVHPRSLPTRSLHRQVARLVAFLLALLLLEGWWRSGPSYVEELENDNELEFYPLELLQDVDEIDDSERLHLAMLHEGCMKHRESVITSDFGRNGDKDSQVGRFQRDDKNLRQKLEKCSDVEVFLPSGIRGDGYCEDAMGYVKYLQGRALPRWVLDVEFEDKKTGRKLTYHDLCPKTPLIFMNHFWDDVPNSPLWPESKPMYLMPMSKCTSWKQSTIGVWMWCSARRRSVRDACECGTSRRVIRDTRGSLHEAHDIRCGAVCEEPTQCRYQVAKNFSNVHFVHTAGKSVFKGTNAVLDCWLSRPDFPPLDVFVDQDIYNIFMRKLYDDQIKAQPDPKKITLHTGRVPSSIFEKQLLGGNFDGDHGLHGVKGMATYVKGGEICDAVERILEMTPDERQAMGERARKQYIFLWWLRICHSLEEQHESLDEMLAFTPEAASSLAQLPLDANFVADAFELPEVPNPSRGFATTGTTDWPRGKDARATPYPKSKPRRRKRPKDELDYLRAKVADLEEELTNLNQSAGRMSPVSDDDEEMFTRWKQVAERQKEEANKTVVENLKLRAMLKGQLEVARRLEAAIATHQQEAVEQAFPWNPIKTEFNVDADGVDDSRRPRAPTQTRRQRHLVRTQGSPFAALLNARRGSRLVVFPALRSKNMPGSIQTRVLNNDHLNATIVDTLQLPKSRHTEVRTRLAVRRYYEANRIVFVWSGCIEIAGSVFVRLREKGVNSVSIFDFLGGSSGVSPPGCILRAVIDVKPEAVEFSTGADTQGHIGEMTDLVLGTYHRNFGLINQVMENLLLNDLMGTSASSRQEDLDHSACSSLDGDEADKDLLDALDEILAYTDLPIETGCHLADAFGPSEALGLGDLPPLLSIEEQQGPTTHGHNDAIHTESLTPSPPQDPQRRAKDLRTAPYAKPMPRRRKRPKDELDYLRAQRRRHLSQYDELFVQWKKIADRQKAETDGSMVENLRLRSMLEGQLNVARSLEAAIQHQQEETAQLLSLHRVKAELDAIDGDRRQRATSLSDDLIFAQLNTGLEAQYAEFDSVMGRTGLAALLQSSNRIQTLHTPDGIAFLHEEARLLPFTMPAVHRAMWSCVRYGKAKELTGHIHTRVVNSDHLNVTIVDKFQLPKSHSIDTCARLAMRRYFEQNRIIVVWSGYVEITGSLFVRLREKGYTSASAFDFSKNAEVSTGSIPGCALRLAVQTKPEMDRFDSEEEARGHIGEVTDLVVGSYHRNFGLMYQVIENLLFRDSTGGEVDEQELARFATYYM
ncbi:hypothetical protein GQ600_25712 [Phytophthora cactorum]|nr:hypothetical protein GQ600_25712 [Phytophthora cactorum]